MREHLYSDKDSHIYRHSKKSSSCKNLCNESCFKVLDSAHSYYNLKIKEAFHITWERPDLSNETVSGSNVDWLMHGVLSYVVAT